MTSELPPSADDPRSAEPDFAELEAEGWTDLHLHPQDPHWQVPLADLPALLSKLGVTHIGLLTLHGVEDLWDDASDVPEPLAEHEDCQVNDLAAMLHRDDVRHLSAVIDPAQTAFLPLMAQCQSQQWHACLLSVGWGLTTVPDADCRRTAARFRWSLAVGGPGVPAQHKDFARNAVQSSAVRAAVAQLSEILGVACTATMTFGE